LTWEPFSLGVAVNKDKTDITILLDRSGSMSSVVDDTIGGFNSFIEGQKKAPGEAVVSLFQFDDQYETVYAGRAIGAAPKLDRSSFVPRGQTALLDAICRTIDDTGARLRALPEDARPALVVLCIITDGQENASRRFDNAAVNERIARQRDVYKWQILFIGSNQDAIAEACKLGLQAGLILNTAPSGMGHKAAYQGLDGKLYGLRGHMVASSGPISAGVASAAMSWTPEEREEQEKLGATKTKATSTAKPLPE